MLFAQLFLACRAPGGKCDRRKYLFAACRATISQQQLTGEAGPAVASTISDTVRCGAFITIAKGPTAILQSGASRRIEVDADRSLELPFRRCMHDGAVGGQLGSRRVRRDAAALRQTCLARGVLGFPNGPMRGAIITALGLLLLGARWSGVGAQTPTCHGTLKPRQVAELMFGRDIGHSLGVSEKAWARFVAHEITPRFPDGLTIADAIGQWRDRDTGDVIREPSKRVEIVLPGNSDDETRLDSIAAAYKRRFHQQSVGIIVRDACVSF
jgi:hypothetical protein